jgi:PAS domain S-box-containing protein
MLDTLLKTTEDAICVLDGQGIFRSMNNAAAVQVGGRPEEYVGKTLWNFFPPELAALFSDYVRQVIDSRKGFVTETRQPLRDGWRWHRTLIEPLHDADGKVSAVLMIARDITDQKSAQEAARRSDEHFRQLFACSPIGMTLFDARGKFLNANRAAREFFGVPEVRHKLDYDLLSDPRLSAEVRARLRAGESVRYEAVYDFDWVRTEYLHDTTRSGVSYFDTVITPLTDGQHSACLGYLIQAQDITERKKADARALSYEHDLRSLTHEILRVEEAERTQLAVDLHDGLTQIMALARIKIGVLEKGNATPEQTRQLDEIRELLDQAVHEARALTSELCPPVLHELGLPAAAGWLAEQIKRRFGLDVRIEDTPQWKPLPKATNSMLFRCLRELLVNVAKHADAGLAQVRFVQSDQAVSLIVADDGRGFEKGFVPEKLPSSVGAGGFGLFSIKQRLAHLGGQLLIESPPSRGSVVRLDLPLIGNNPNDSEKTS